MASLMFISTAISHIGVVDILTDGVCAWVRACVPACMYMRIVLHCFFLYVWMGFAIQIGKKKWSGIARLMCMYMHAYVCLYMSVHVKYIQ